MKFIACLSKIDMNVFARSLIGALVLFVTFGLAVSASAAPLLFSGTIFDVPVTIDYHQFEVVTPGVVDIDVLSENVLGGDGNQGSSDLDSMIYLFDFDAFGDLGLLGAKLGVSDDGGPGNDGSTGNHDSFLSLFLGSGDYVIAISNYLFHEAEARAGVDNGLSFFPGTFADYEIRVSLPTAVPEPATLTLFGLGLLGLGAARRRRKLST